MARQIIDPEARVMTQAQVDAYNAKRATARAERLARKARREEVRTPAPRPVDALTALAVGASHMFPAPKYRSTTQVSSTIRSAYIKNGFRFTSRIARSLIDGQSVIGVTVTRTE